MSIFNIMYTDGYVQLVDKHLRETPISTTPFPNYINSCSTNNSTTNVGGAIRKVPNTVVLPGFVAYPYLDDPFDVIDNQDKYLLHDYSNTFSNSINTSFTLEINNYYSQFCKYKSFIHRFNDINAKLLHSYNQQLYTSMFNIINSYDNQKDTICNNINYLEYFYHMFPIHVKKFYYTFHAIINPHICTIIWLIWRLWCCSYMISSHSSTLTWHLGTIRSFGRSVDLKDFVEQHKRALDKLTKDIREKLCEDIQHIEKVLDNAVEEITKKVQVILERIHKDFIKKIQAIEKVWLSLPYKLDYILKLSIDAIREDLNQTYDADAEEIETEIKYLIEKMPIAANRIFSIFRGRRGSVNRLIPLGVKFKKEDIVKISEIEGVEKLEKGRIKADVTNRIDRLKFLQRHSRDTRNSMNGMIQEIQYSDYNLVGRRTFQYYIAKLKKIKSYYGGLENRVRVEAMMESWDVLKKISGISDKSLLLPELESLIGVFEGKGKQSTIGDRVNKIKVSIEGAIKKLKAIRRYVTFLMSLERLVVGLREVNHIDFSTRDINKMIKYAQIIEKIINPIKKNINWGFENIKGVVSIENGNNAKTVILGSIITGIQNRLNIDTKSYVNNLKSIQTIQGHLETIKKKKEELSLTKSKASEITKVETGITQLKEVQKTIEAFSGIAEEIRSLEQAYYFERITLWDISGDVEGLMSIIPKIVDLKSHIDSYIKFLEAIKECSRTVEYYWSMKNSLTSIGDVTHRLGLTIWKIIDGLEKIKTKVSEMNSIRCRLKMEEIKEYIPKLRDNVSAIEKLYGSIQNAIDDIKSMDEKIKQLCIIINRLDCIGHYINCSTSSLKSMGITYSRPSTWDIRKFISASSKIKPEIDRINLYTIQPIYKKIKSITSEIDSLEKNICLIISTFLMCSIKSIISNTKESDRSFPSEPVHGFYNSEIISTSLKKTTLANPGGSYDSIWKILSHSTLTESKFVLSRLYECHKKKEEIKETFEKVVCECYIQSGCEDKADCMKRILSHENMGKTLYKWENEEINNEQNHICMCLVIRYVMYPSLMKCANYVANIDFDLLSIMDRKFNKFNKSFSFDLNRTKLASFFVEMANKLSILVKEKYLTHFLITPYGRFHCFCISPKDSYYLYFISTILHISSLVENMFMADFKDVVDRTQKFVPVLSDLDLINSNCTNIPSKGPQEGKPCQAQNSTCVNLTHRKYSRRGLYYIMVRRTKHPPRSKLPSRWISGSRIKNEYLTPYQLTLSVTCKPFEEDNFGIETALPFLDIKKVEEESKNLVESGCVSQGNFKNGNELERINCHTYMIVGICLNMVRKKFDLIKMQISENSALYMLLELEYLSNGPKMNQIIKRMNEEIIKIIIISRNNRVCDSKNEITNKKMTNVNEGYYSYNDAYRINASRAHGSLKYIIIKLVLILIIVLMTVFIRVKIEIDENNNTINGLVEENGDMCECIGEGTEMKEVMVTK